MIKYNLNFGTLMHAACLRYFLETVENIMFEFVFLELNNKES